MHANAKIAKAISDLMTRSPGAARLRDAAGASLVVYNHEGEDSHVDLEFDDREYRLEIHGPL